MGNLIIPPSHREDATGSVENQVIECDTSAVSDGYHTFGELYDHRCLLFLAFLKNHTSYAWKSRSHDDGSKFDGWFIVGTTLGGHAKQITYHLPDKYWDLCKVTELERSPKWDGHTSFDVLDRLERWLKQ